MIEKHKRIGYAALSCVIVTLMITCAVIPGIVDTDTDASSSEEQYDDVGWLINYNQLRIMLACNFWSAGMGIIEIGNAISGIDVEYEASYGDTVKAHLRTLEAQNTAEKVIIVSKLSASLVDNDRQTWTLTESYLNRAAEIGASSIWYDGGTYDADAVLDYAGIYDLLSTGDFNTQYALDWAYDQAGNRISHWTADYATSMQIGIVWNGGTTGYATSGLNLDYCTIVTSTSGKNLVYLDTESLSGDMAGVATNKTIYNFNSSPATITSTLVGGQSVTLAVGSNDITALGLTSGWYTLSSGVYGGQFMSSTNSNTAASTVGGAVIVCDSSIGYAVSTSTGVTVTWNGTQYESAYLRYQILADGVITDSSVTDEPDAVTKMVQTYAAYYAELKNRLYSAAQAGLVVWNISSAAHESNLLLSPSSVIPQLTNLNIDAAQSYAIYMATLDQLSTYYTEHDELLATSQATISEQSLQLYCYGSIYSSDGTLIAENVIYTPYVYVRDMEVSTAGYNILEQSGMAMVWNTTATSLTGWTNDSTDYQMVLLDKGTYFTCSGISYKSGSVSSVTLEVKKIVTTGVLGDAWKGREDSPKTFDATTLIMIILISIGLNIVQLGWIANKSAFLIIVGVVMVVLGVFASDMLAGFLLGV